MWSRREKNQLKIGLIIGLIVTIIGTIAAIFIPEFRQFLCLDKCSTKIEIPTTGNDSVGHIDTTKTSTSGPRFKKTYNVILVLPSRMSNAIILVDNKPASIVSQTPTVVTIQVIEKTTIHQFTIKYKNDSCTTYRLIREDSLHLALCQ
jgi:hypothetical protein